MELATYWSHFSPLFWRSRLDLSWPTNSESGANLRHLIKKISWQNRFHGIQPIEEVLGESEFFNVVTGCLVFIRSHNIKAYQCVLGVAYRCEMASEISRVHPLAAIVSPSFLSGRSRLKSPGVSHGFISSRPKRHVFRMASSLRRICSLFFTPRT